jgi:uncharacterized membrane protein (UPF0127 family)
LITTPAGTNCFLQAATEAAREQGLMGARTTAPWAGMLFTFGRLETSGFWMKDTLIPLDIAFVGGTGVVQEVQTMQPCPAEMTNCPVYTPAKPYLSAIEVEAGRAGALGLSAGSPVRTGSPC